ncbi:MAG TPA: GNAT family N-acetyltransferase [Flavobacterium sp.]|nr:GNAT family N-acetyltransferase [Flavobacterium sp.]
MALQVIKYCSEYYDLWNEFVQKSINGTFLFHRDFMEYHSDRFCDYSLLVLDEKKIVAIFPANIRDKVVYTHQGLTYGGLIVQNGERTTNQLDYFQVIFDFLISQNIQELIIKETPVFYHKHFNDILPYVSYISEAKTIKSEICSVIDLTVPFRQSKSIRRDANNAEKKGISVHETDDLSFFWEHILTANLNKKYHTNPVHSYEEITLLKQRFPENIQFYELKLDNKIIGGTVLFINHDVVHVQYISGLGEYRQLGGLDLLFTTLINRFKNTKKYFDFGTSNEDNGKKINQGLLFWKEGFGARVCTQKTYSFQLKNNLLESIYL